MLTREEFSEEEWVEADKVFRAWAERHPYPEAPFVDVGVLETVGFGGEDQGITTALSVADLARNMHDRSALGKSTLNGLRLVAEAKGKTLLEELATFSMAPPRASREAQISLLVGGLRSQAKIRGDQRSEAELQAVGTEMIEFYEHSLITGETGAL